MITEQNFIFIFNWRYRADRLIDAGYDMEIKKEKHHYLLQQKTKQIN